MNKNSPIPLYDQLVTVLIDYIKQQMSVDEKMLSEREICEKYEVSRTTVRQALSELQEMGFIYKRQGKGTYASGLWKEMKNLSETYSFTEQMKKLGKKPVTDIVSFESVSAIPYIAENLGIEPGENVYKLKRLRKADDIKMMMETTFIPETYFQGLSLTELESMPLYELYPNLYKQEISYADEEFFASIVQSKEAEQLDIPNGSPCLRIYRKTFNQDNKIIEYTISVARADQFTYKIRHVKK